MGALYCFAVLFTANLAAQPATLTVTVADENSVAVPNARITLQFPNAPLLRCETRFDGRCVFTNLEPGRERRVLRQHCRG